MKLLTFIEGGEYLLGVVTDKGIVDVKAAGQALQPQANVPLDVHEAIKGGAAALAALRKTVDAALVSDNCAAFFCDRNRS